MRKVVTMKGLAFLGLIATVAMVVAGEDRAQARPKYFAGFGKKYTGLTSQAKKVKCNVCHYGKSKKNRNDYGTALMKNVKKNEKDPAKIDAALEKTEKAKNAKGQTFGSLIEAGKLPGTTPAE